MKYLFLFFSQCHGPWSLLVSESTRGWSLISLFVEFFQQFAVRNEDGVIVCRTLGLDWKATKQKENNNSNGTNGRANRICVLRTWCEIRMFIVNIKTCRRHDVIGHIICIRALYECIGCRRAVLPKQSREMRKKNCEKIVIECVWHTPYTAHSDCVTFDDTRVCRWNINAFRSVPHNHLLYMPHRWWYADYCTCIDFAGGHRTKSECDALRRS